MNQRGSKRKRQKTKGKSGYTRETSATDNASDRSGVKDTEKDNSFGGNSIEWYSRYPSLTLAAGSIPYPYKPGMDVPVGRFKVLPTAASPTVQTVTYPGMLALCWQPSVGYSTTPTSPISIVGKEVYAKVREKFSGALDADAPDFVIYLMALDSIFAYIAHLKRIYRCLNAYSPENLFTPDGILSALGFGNSQVQELRANKMELYQRINELVLMTRKFKCPRIMDVFNRHVWLNDHVFTDAPTIKSQMYVFRQTGWYDFAMMEIPDVEPQVLAGSLRMATPTYPTTGVVEYLYTFGRKLIDDLASSDDGYLISGYLMRAYEGYPDFYVDELLLGEMLIPKYNEEVLGEIENAHTLPLSWSSVVSTIQQNPSTNTIISRPRAYYNTNSDPYKMGWDGMYPRLSSRNDVPQVAETVINSRMMTYLKQFEPAVNGMAAATIECCTEIYTHFYIVEMITVDGEITYQNQAVSSEMLLDVSGASAPSNISRITELLSMSQWDWAPLIFVTMENGTVAKNVVVNDIHNFTTTSIDTLENLNKVCLYSLFNAFSA